MRPSEVRALAVDYDRTLTDDRLVVVPAALAALAAARTRGLRVVVVSGRDLPFLEAQLGHVADAIVAENGALWTAPGSTPRRTREAREVRGALARLGVEIEYGEVIASIDAAHEPAVAEALRAAGMDAAIIRNRDRIMVLPRGVDKAAGLLAALAHLGVPAEQAAAAGDGENDVAMLSAVGYAIAVANAVDELKAVADHVTAEVGGHGIAAWLERVWMPATDREGARGRAPAHPAGKGA